MVYIVTYDLIKPVREYPQLLSRIKSYQNWACLGGSSYLIETNSTPVQVRDFLREVIDGNDQLFVGKISAPAAWVNYSKEVSDWIKLKLK